MVSRVKSGFVEDTGYRPKTEWFSRSCVSAQSEPFFKRHTSRFITRSRSEEKDRPSLFTSARNPSESLGIVEVTETLPKLGGATITPEAIGRVVLCLIVTLVSFEVHPVVLQAVHSIWEDVGSSSADARFFNFLSLVFSILLGGTFTFQYRRLTTIVREVFNEIYVLELFWYRCKQRKIGLEKELKRSVRRYIDFEILFTEDKASPFQQGSALVEMFDVIDAKSLSGLDMSEIKATLEKLGLAQSNRSGATTRVLPYVHWAMLWGIAATFVLAFLTFEPFTSIDEVSGPRNASFAILCGMIFSLVLIVQDLSMPIQGIYSFRKEVKERLGYLRNELQL